VWDMFFRPSGAWGDFTRIPHPRLAPWATIFRPLRGLRCQVDIAALGGRNATLPAASRDPHLHRIRMARLPSFGKPAEDRSANMRAIKSSGNKTTEYRLVSLLKEHGLRGWRLHPPHILGNPDLLIPKRRVAIFVDGCFWHGCPKCGHVPKTNKPYWRAKITRNRTRDLNITGILRKSGYRVVRLWECDLRQRPSLCLGRIRRATQSGAPK
jgi:DNA mismatch endonuclease (patch repair protein)